MKQKTVQKIALDSCVVIEIIQRRSFADRLRNYFFGKPVRLVLCDVVLREVQRIRGFGPYETISKISKLVGKKVETYTIDDQLKLQGKAISAQYMFCHRGDNLILAMCKAMDFVLLSFDRMFLKACELVGVRAISPKTAKVEEIV
jgi:predicted nucleic acid-binding protein